MAARRIGAGQLRDAVNGILAEYRNATREDVKAAVDKTARKTAAAVRKASPARTGRYRKGWTHAATRESAMGHARTVYQRDSPGLPHLLQHGHGGPRPARAHPHIQEDAETLRVFEKCMEEELGG